MRVFVQFDFGEKISWSFPGKRFDFALEFLSDTFFDYIRQFESGLYSIEILQDDYFYDCELKGEKGVPDEKDSASVQ